MIRQAVIALSHLLAPRVCRVCHQTLTASEDIMCLKCKLDLPRANLHLLPFNTIHQRLGHHYAVDRAAGWFIYKRGSRYAQMLIDAKYGDLPRLARKLAEQCASELVADRFFDGIDFTVPMPMHWWKRLRRGYNQAEEICQGIYQATGLEWKPALKAVRGHGVQSRHNRKERFQSIANTMVISDAAYVQGKHILLVDDIITTGASVLEALRALYQAQPASVSVLALGVAMLDS